ncbi:Nif3-like dinuclear metal center hexameric protein [Lagierella massiliensis]|uniref:Nif3-like dinuclear metal center hexameric protein n=1 Tax=Lagierella massiliensis TaxID=1689303 RepID=UPI0006D8202E|nr:Nif3-like dinuclear metal center hexameric protein [Lagierella massiliensis]
MKVIEVINKFEEDCPLSLQEDWDNSGVQVDFSKEVLKGIVIGLDLSKELVDFAIEKNINFIFLHHPFFFEEIKSLDFYSNRGRILELLVKNRITVYSAHTNFDKVSFGVSNILAEKLGLKNNEVLFKEEDSENGLGKKSEIEKISLFNMAEFVKDKLNLSSLVSYGDLNEEVEKVAVMGGSGAFAIDKCIDEKIDLLITGDIKYHDGQKALENNLSILDIGHYNSEIDSIDFLFKYFCKLVEEEIYIFKFDISKRKII